MNAKFEDIRSRINEEPTWHDSNGTPRYGKFHPDLCPNIYADEVVLVEIACQECGKKFMVEMHYERTHAGVQAHLFGKDKEFQAMEYLAPFSENLKRYPDFVPHYGDPPCHGDGCHAGDTMNCDDIRIVELWRKNRNPWGWVLVKGENHAE